jgi:osmotically-inducible protein OsmY
MGKKIIEHALARYSSTVDQNIRVRVEDNTITLNGTVQSFYQKEEAEKIAWNAPGVLMVTNELVIG